MKEAEDGAGGVNGGLSGKKRNKTEPVKRTAWIDDLPSVVPFFISINSNIIQKSGQPLNGSARARNEGRYKRARSVLNSTWLSPTDRQAGRQIRKEEENLCFFLFGSVLFPCFPPSRLCLLFITFFPRFFASTVDWHNGALACTRRVARSSRL